MKHVDQVGISVRWWRPMLMNESTMLKLQYGTNESGAGETRRQYYQFWSADDRISGRCLYPSLEQDTCRQTLALLLKEKLLNACFCATEDFHPCAQQQTLQGHAKCREKTRVSWLQQARYRKLMYRQPYYGPINESGHITGYRQ